MRPLYRYIIPAAAAVYTVAALLTLATEPGREAALQQGPAPVAHVALAGTALAAPTPAVSDVAAAPADHTPVQVPVPVRLRIPAIGVDAPVEVVGIAADGSMAAPQSWGDVGWYEYGALPGQLGNATLVGHLDSTTGPAVFWHLGSLTSGNALFVVMSDGSLLSFTVHEQDRYPYNDAPYERLFGPATTANLNLITCAGAWDAQQHNYLQRTVVYAQRQ
jgi:sortase (surface protein transpeptidase)